MIKTQPVDPSSPSHPLHPSKEDGAEEENNHFEHIIAYTSFSFIIIICIALYGVWIAHLVERLTEKTGAILIRCRFEAPVRQGIFSLVQQGIFLTDLTSIADSLAVSIQHPCAVACINICAHVKIPKHWQPYIYTIV